MMSVWKLRPFNGIFSTKVWSTTVLTVAEVVFTRGAPACTVTLSETEPTTISQSITSASWTCRLTSGRTSFLNPGFSTSIWYVPGGRFASVYSPAPLVTVSYRKFVPALTAATFASGMVAFDGSVTRPVMEPFVVCARGAGIKRQTESQQEKGDSG